MANEDVQHITNENIEYAHNFSSKQVYYEKDYVTCYPRVKSNR